MEQTLNFDIVSGIKAMTSEYSQLDDAYLVAHFDEDFVAWRQNKDAALRIDGMTVLLIKKGHIDLELNMEHYEASGPSICVMHPSSRMKFYPHSSAGIDCHILFMSRHFLQSININMSIFNFPTMVEHPSPVMEITPEEYSIFESYLHLLVHNTTDSVSRQLSLGIGSGLVSVFIYELVKLHSKRVNAAESAQAGRQRSPRISYVHDFVKLVRAHYTMERSVAFYASKLCISPKYLSLIVKEATGRSAARWIDEFVLMEAKNMLRYSGKNIQQVAYALNFTNQSSFGKYFKHLTGMSPTEYQKS